jgi:GxxExxY protein
MNEELLYADLTYKVIGLGMQVHRTFGHGYLEKVYENSLMVLFRKSGIFAEQQMPIKVRFEGEIVGDYRADILVDRKLILELKVVNGITPIHKAQTLNYLKATCLDLALILNFGAHSFEHYRLINRLAKPEVDFKQRIVQIFPDNEQRLGQVSESK